MVRLRLFRNSDQHEATEAVHTDTVNSLGLVTGTAPARAVGTAGVVRAFDIPGTGHVDRGAFAADVGRAARQVLGRTIAAIRALEVGTIGAWAARLLLALVHVHASNKCISCGAIAINTVDRETPAKCAPVRKSTLTGVSVRTLTRVRADGVVAFGLGTASGG